MMSVIGLVGGLAFAFAAVPAAVATVKAGRSLGTPISIAWAILIGCVCLYAYLTSAHGFDLILSATYGVETASWSAIIWMHYMPKRRK